MFCWLKENLFCFLLIILTGQTKFLNQRLCQKRDIFATWFLKFLYFHSTMNYSISTDQKEIDFSFEVNPLIHFLQFLSNVISNVPQTLIIAQKLYLTWKIALIDSLMQDSKYQHGHCKNLMLQWNYHERDSVHISVSSDQPQFARKHYLPSSRIRSLFTRCGVTGTNGQSYQ